jgi:hypothetical protein
MLGATCSWWLKSSWAMLWGILGLTITLVSICYGAFLIGWWIPLIPAWLSLLGGFLILLFILNKKIEKLRYRRILSLLIHLYQENPSLGAIAIEYFKQSESQENQALIESQLLAKM